MNSRDLPQLPSGWDWVKIDDVTTSVRDGTHAPPPRTIEGIPLLSARNIKDGYIDWDEDYTYISEQDYININQTNSIKKDDILLTTVGTLGRACVLKEEIPFTVQRSVAILRVKKNIIYPSYMKYYFNSSFFKKILIRYSNTTAQSGIYLGMLKKFKIPLAPLNEQKQITKKLSNFDSMIYKTKIIIQNLQILKKGLMQRLFTEGIGHTEFKETRLGKIPKEWEVVRISDIGNVIGGGTPDTKNDDYWNGDILWATPTDITKYNIKYISNTDRKITREGLNSSSAKILPPYSLLLTSRATIGYCVINKDEICTNQGFQNIIPNEKINVEFLYYMIQSEKIQNQLIRSAYGSTFLEIPNKDVKKIKIPVPNLAEQESIAKILSDLDNKTENEKILKKIIKKIKRGLIQDLLTGKKRVKIN